MPEVGSFASKSVTAHMIRGLLGLGLLVGSVALIPLVGYLSLLLAPLGVAALRGCPTCWAIGLVHTVSRGRIERSCTEGQCRATQWRPAVSTATSVEGPSSGPSELPIGPPRM